MVKIVERECRKSKNARLACKAAIRHGLDVRPPSPSLCRTSSWKRAGYDSQLIAKRPPINFTGNGCKRNVYVVLDVACRFKTESSRMCDVF